MAAFWAITNATPPAEFSTVRTTCPINRSDFIRIDRKKKNAAKASWWLNLDGVWCVGLEPCEGSESLGKPKNLFVPTHQNRQREQPDWIHELKFGEVGLAEIEAGDCPENGQQGTVNALYI